ncbi:MAG: site-specific integrase [Fimbriimonadaceae bacterium]|nr:MAG: site-specific integrase [Fimbriimonadaceae bacterium]
MSKRGNGEGSICQRKDGKWVGAVSLGRKPNGKVNRKYFYGATKKEVREKMVACLHDQQRGLITVGSKQSVGTFMLAWLSDVAKPRVRRTTYRSYEQIIRNHIVPGIGRVQLSKLNSQDVQRFLKSVHDKSISCDPIRRVLRVALSQAVEWELIARNPAAIKNTPKREKKEAQFLTVEQSQLLLQACNTNKYGALFKTLILLGLRSGEALALQWSDVKWAEAKIRINKQLQFHDGQWHLLPPKSKHSNRVLPLFGAVLDALRDAEALQRQYRMVNRARWEPSDFIFTTSIGTPLDSKNVRREFKSMLKMHGLPDIRIHDLRHTNASILLATGTSARVISELLGHSQVSFTLSVYAHAMQELHVEAMDRLSERLCERPYTTSIVE